MTDYTPTKLEALQIRERPASRVSLDSSMCNLPELLAVLIGGSTQIEVAERLVSAFDGDMVRIYNTHPEQVARKVEGLGITTAIKIKAAIALTFQIRNEIRKERPTIHSPADIAALVATEMSMLQREELWVMILSTRNHVLEIRKLYKGTNNSCTVKSGEIFRPAIELNAASIAVIHNHPSGDPAPSPDDVALTKSLVDSGKMLDIEVLDHLVIGANGQYVSLKEKRLGGL